MKSSNYSFVGQGENALVFIHGVGLNKKVWQPQVDQFVDRYQILVYDMLGHGNSHRPNATVTLDDYVAQLADLLDALKLQPVTLIGHSMGALVAVAFALTHPEKVERLVPMNIVYQRNLAKREAVVARAEKVLLDGAITGIDGTLARWFSDKTDPISLAKVKQIGEWMGQVDPVGYGRTYKLFATSDDAFTGRLGELSMPVLYLTGENDPNSTPAMSQQMAAETPNGRVSVVIGEAHMMAYINPDKVNRHLEDFLVNSPAQS